MIDHALRPYRMRWLPAIGVLVTLVALWLAARIWWEARAMAVDRSAQADRAHAAGRHADAATLYAGALRSKASPLGRAEIERRLARCVGEIDEPAAAVATALSVLDVAPELSFGKYDYLVARAVGNRTAGMYGVDATNALEELLGQSHTAPRPEDRPVLERALTRLNVFLDGRGGTSEERQEAASLRDSVRAALAGEPLRLTATLVTPVAEPPLPEGTIDELRTSAHDSSKPPFERGKAAFAAARKLEEEGDTAAALAAYRDAFELIRKVLPFYQRGDGRTDWYPELRLLDMTAKAIARLDPTRPVPLNGGLHFHVEGVPIPAGLEFQFAPVLVDATLAPPVRVVESSEGFALFREVHLRSGEAPWVGVADGKYRLSVSGKTASRNANAGDPLPDPLLDADYSGLPTEVEVHGNTLDLAVRVYRRQELRQLDPPDHAPVNLRTAVFRWTPVEGAAFYRVQFTVHDEKRRLISGVGSFDVSSTTLALGDEKGYTGKFYEPVPRGVTVEWSVRAYNTKELEIGTLVDGVRHVLVAEPLADDAAPPR